MKQLGWDDFWAIVTLLAAIILVAVLLATVLLDLRELQFKYSPDSRQ